MKASAKQTVEYLQSWDKLRQLQKLPDPRCINGYSSLDDFVLRNARAWAPRPTPDTIRMGTIKECFRNAAELVLHNPRTLVYCEGYALNLIPVMHAWVIDNEGNVIDNTWRTLGKEYFGIAIQFKYLVRSLRVNKVYGLIDNWQGQWPILRADPQDWRHPIMDNINGHRTRKETT